MDGSDVKHLIGCLLSTSAQGFLRWTRAGSALRGPPGYGVAIRTDWCLKTVALNLACTTTSFAHFYVQSFAFYVE
jgi:hypothetical protein